MVRAIFVTCFYQNPLSGCKRSSSTFASSRVYITSLVMALKLFLCSLNALQATQKKSRLNFLRMAQIWTSPRLAVLALQHKAALHIVIICRNCHILIRSCYIPSDFLDIVTVLVSRVKQKYIDIYNTDFQLPQLTYRIMTNCDYMKTKGSKSFNFEQNYTQLKFKPGAVEKNESTTELTDKSTRGQYVF